MKRLVLRTAMLLALTSAYVSSVDAGGARLYEGDYYCDVFIGESCISNYCGPLIWPGHDCRYQSGHDDCECIGI
jgi:hypothetical protein